ncbi:MAG: hypothetical protein IJP31_04540 [Lachnospiraceae bacterium]|nr:hypothetical protein [Lachnospiraceae bacterium]
MEGILFFIGGRLYTWFELLWRGRTHWTMFLVGGLCFVIMGLLNEYRYTWDMPLVRQSLISAVIITGFEFVTGCIVNLWLGWDIWDYSDLPFNLFGQICLYYFFLWIPLSILGILLDDWLRYLFYRLFHKIFPLMEKRERPQYRLF